MADELTEAQDALARALVKDIDVRRETLAADEAAIAEAAVKLAEREAAVAKRVAKVGKAEEAVEAEKVQIEAAWKAIEAERDAWRTKARAIYGLVKDDAA